MEPLETKRLMLRPFEEGDAADLYAFASDERVGDIGGRPVHASLAHSRAILQELMADEEMLAIVWKESGRVIGFIEVLRRDPEGKHPGIPHRELSYALHPDYWGRGIMPEAAQACIRLCFETLGVERIYCGYYNDNRKSLRVMEKNGFRHLFDRPKTMPDGEERTEHYYILTKEMWRP